jgi:diguanylate cyclase (GGDEF)-like protein
LRPAADVADPRRGTAVAVALPAVALVLSLLWAFPGTTGPTVSLPLVLALVAAPVFAERISVQLGPRSWYTASTPTIVLAGLLGGPLVGVAAGVAGQIGCTGSVWRRRCAEGGLGAIQGWTAGIAGGLALGGAGGAIAISAVALCGSVAVNTAGRAAILLARNTRPFTATFRRGLTVDVVEAVIVTPLVATLVYTATSSELMTAAALASGLAMLTIAHHLRVSTIEALAAEQAIARRDQLTGAPNRRAFEEALAAEHARVVRGNLPAGLFVVDVDRFKTINDRFGHAVGDEALVAIVGRLIGSLRPSDVVARWGGEEITVLAPGLGGRHALERFATRIRDIVGEAPFPTSGHEIPVTVSVGATLLDGSVPPLTALRFADDALYVAKQTRDASAVRLAPAPLPRLGPATPRSRVAPLAQAPLRRVTAASAPRPTNTVPET